MPRGNDRLKKGKEERKMSSMKWYTRGSRMGRREFLKLMGATAASLGIAGIAGCAPRPAPTPTPVGPIHLDFVVWSYSVETILDNIEKFEAAWGAPLSAIIVTGWPVNCRAKSSGLAMVAEHRIYCGDEP